MGAETYIKIKKGTIETVIVATDFERAGYEKAGWEVVDKDWTKERVVKKEVDITAHLGTENLAKIAKKK